MCTIMTQRETLPAEKRSRFLRKIKLFFFKPDLGYPDGIITAIFHTLGVICWIWSSRLHPFGGDDPRFIITYLQTAEVAESGAAFRDGDNFGIADDAELCRIEFRHEQGGAMTENVVIVCSASGVD